MLRLASILYSLIGTTLAGSAMVVALVMGWDTAQPLIIAVVLGALVAVPVTLLIAREIVKT